MTGLVLVQVEDAAGPGVDFELDPAIGLVGRRVRNGAGWLGFDRAALSDSDDGSGRLVPVVVALPSSTFRGAHLLVELVGGWRSQQATVLLGRLPGAPAPPEPVARVVAGVPIEAESLATAAAEAEARAAHQRHRERRSRSRILGGKAWHGLEVEPPRTARFGTPHSLAEYSLRRLPPRYVRGFAGLLDDGERILYWVERPALGEPSIADRLRRIDRRAALLAVTDRQLLWMVDHAQPDRFLQDWGIEVEIIPIERIRAATSEARDGWVTLDVTTSASATRPYRMPIELRAEVDVLASLVARFTPPHAARLPMRQYELDAVPFDEEAAARYGQLDEARRLRDAAIAGGEVLAILFSPRREAQRLPAALVLRPSAVEVLTPTTRRIRSLDAVCGIGMTLSPLVGRVDFGERVVVTYPAPLGQQATAFVRLARRALAMA